MVRVIMNITKLKYVLELANASSMREAASRLFVSQPALSASIRELEEEIGEVLFERNNKGMYLTDAGREFITYAKKAVAQYEILEDRYLSRDSDKEHFSVSTQHYNFAIKAFTEVIKNNDPDIRKQASEPPCQFQTVHVRHFNVRHDYVRLQFFRHLQRFRPVSGRSADLKSQLIPVQSPLDHFNDFLLVVNHQY